MTGGLTNLLSICDVFVFPGVGTCCEPYTVLITCYETRIGINLTFCSPCILVIDNINQPTTALIKILFNTLRLPYICFGHGVTIIRGVVRTCVHFTSRSPLFTILCVGGFLVHYSMIVGTNDCVLRLWVDVVFVLNKFVG